MNTTEARVTVLDSQALADADAVMLHVINGTPIDPDLKRRVEERADRITEEIRQTHGYVDVDNLVRSARDET
jgi:predicted ATP-grasp superfamily ATP-dependent carboligase